MKGLKVVWTEEMVQKLKQEFEVRFTADIASDLSISLRTVIRKARELKLEKEEGFLEKNREEITKRANAAKPANPMKGIKGWSVPGSEKTRFKPGQTPKNNPEKTRLTRNETIRKEKQRIKYGLPQKTNLKLVNIY